MSNNSIYIALAGKLLPHTVVFFIMGIFYNVYLYGFLHFPCNSGIFPMILATLCLVIGITMLWYCHDRNITYVASGPQLCLLVGRLVVLRFGFLLSGDGNEPGVARTQCSLSVAATTSLSM